MMTGWHGVDLDGTLAQDGGWHTDGVSIGEPVPAMLERVKAWLANGEEVRIVTARVCTNQPAWRRRQYTTIIEQWCLKHVGRLLLVTAEKDFNMIDLWDDRAVQVEVNTGRRIGDHIRA